MYWGMLLVLQYTKGNRLYPQMKERKAALLPTYQLGCRDTKKTCLIFNFMLFI